MSNNVLCRLRELNPDLKIKSVEDKSFSRYGRVYKNLKVEGYLNFLDKNAKPSDDIFYEADFLGTQFNPDEFTPIINTVYGGMDYVQVGMCHGKNKKLNALEYHKGTELIIAGADMVIMLGHADDIDWPEGTLDTAKIQPYFVPRGTVYEIAARGLHYAPAHVHEDQGFRVVVFLPKGTNDALPFTPAKQHEEDLLLLGKNKWFLAHAEDKISLAAGAHVGLTGKNLCINT